MASVACSETRKKEYTKFVIKIVKKITSDIFDKFKYVLRNKVEAATMEKMRNPLDLFQELERRDLIGPENLTGLRELLEMSGEPDLVSMLEDFGSSLGMSLSKAVAKSCNSLWMNGYCLQITGGKHYNKESEGEYVEVKSGSNYGLVIKNFEFHRCLFAIKIDGHVVLPESNINPYQEISIDAPYQRRGNFHFFALSHAPSASGINRWKNENGLVEVTFTPERKDMMIICRFDDGGSVTCKFLSCSNETTDVSLRGMISSVLNLDETKPFSVHFGCKPIGQRNIKLTQYGISNRSRVEIKLGLVGGGLKVPPSVTQSSVSDDNAPKWVAGATALQGSSRQTFPRNTLPDFVPDTRKSTTLYLRLVAKADDKQPSFSKEYSPLARETLIPPPVVQNW